MGQRGSLAIWLLIGPGCDSEPNLRRANDMITDPRIKIKNRLTPEQVAKKWESKRAEYLRTDGEPVGSYESWRRRWLARQEAARLDGYVRPDFCPGFVDRRLRR